LDVSFAQPLFCFSVLVCCDFETVFASSFQYLALYAPALCRAKNCISFHTHARCVSSEDSFFPSPLSVPPPFSCTHLLDLSRLRQYFFALFAEIRAVSSCSPRRVSCLSSLRLKSVLLRNVAFLPCGAFSCRVYRSSFLTVPEIFLPPLGPSTPYVLTTIAYYPSPPHPTLFFFSSQRSRRVTTYGSIQHPFF